MFCCFFHILRKTLLGDVIMTRTTSVKADLHEYSLNELKKLRNSYPTEIGRNVLTTVVMLTEGNSIKQISDFLALNVITIYTYLNRWNELGIAALEDYRGKTPSNCKMTAEMEYDLLYVVQHKVPNDFGFLGNVWTAKLLSDYLYQNYEIRLSPQCIRDTLHKNNFSFKRAQKKPSKGVKSEQETFKKNDRNYVFCRKRF